MRVDGGQRRERLHHRGVVDGQRLSVLVEPLFVPSIADDAGDQAKYAPLRVVVGVEPVMISAT